MCKLNVPHVEFEVLTAVVMNVANLWNTAPCSLYVNRRFGLTYHPHLQVRNSAEQETSVPQVGATTNHGLTIACFSRKIMCHGVPEIIGLWCRFTDPSTSIWSDGSNQIYTHLKTAEVNYIMYPRRTLYAGAVFLLSAFDFCTSVYFAQAVSESFLFGRYLLQNCAMRRFSP
jgi:hypothetical protein